MKLEVVQAGEIVEEDQTCSRVSVTMTRGPCKQYEVAGRKEGITQYEAV